jgi:hypothetical protein
MAAISPIDIDTALTDRKLLGAGLGNLDDWFTWRVALKAAFALGLISDREREIFEQISGGREPPKHRVRELWCIVGRRGGKSRMAALIAIFIALFVKANVAPGETPCVLALAATTDQARVVFGYCRAFLEKSPILRREIENITASEIKLRRGAVISVHPNNFRSTRGRTLVACVFDECSFWRDDNSASPDREVYSAILPSLATTISSAYRRAGLMYSKHRDYFGVSNDDVLVLCGTSLQFNPTLDATIIEAQRAADPFAARSEWDSEFRPDISEFLSDQLIEAAIDHGRPLELPPRKNFNYTAFTDASGGTGKDAYTLAIGHPEGEHFIVDVLRGSVSGQLFDPIELTQRYAELLKEYRVHTITGDYYAAEWVSSAWAKTGITYLRSEIPKSQVYLETAPLFARGVVSLPDHRLLLRQLRLLERKTHRSGRDTVDHPRSGSDDFANAACGVLALMSKSAGSGYDLETLAKANGTWDERVAAERELARLVARGERRPLSGPLSAGARGIGNGGYVIDQAASIAQARDGAAAHANERPRNIMPS